MASKRIKWKDRTTANDIKYGGFLSYRHLRLIAWFCLIVAQVSIVLKLQVKLNPDSAAAVDGWNMVISIFAGLPVPLFLLANLSTILQSRGNFKGLFIRYGGIALALYILANFIVFHFGFRTMNAINPATNWGDAAELFGTLLPAFGKNAYTLNIFIDMLLVVLLFFFMNYAPRSRIFKGKLIIIFRLLILLPIAYEVVGLYLKCNIQLEYFSLPSPVFFLLPSKPPFIFAAFVVIVIALKLSKLVYLKRKGHTEESYADYIQTKAHSLKVSLAISIVFLIFAIIDVITFIGLGVLSFKEIAEALPSGSTEDQINTLFLDRMSIYENIGFGGAIGLILIIPLVLLFSYSKTHKNPTIDLLIPVAGIALIAVVILEGCFQVITLNLASFMDKMRELVAKWTNAGDGGETQKEGSAILTVLTNIRYLL